MTSLTTNEMIRLATAWLRCQTATTPQSILSQLWDMSVALLAPSIPPAQVPSIPAVDLTTQQVIDLGINWLSAQEHLTPEQFLTQVRDGSIGYLNALPVPVPPAGNIFRGVMFFPWQIHGTGATPAWPGNTNTDSLLGFASDHGNSWEREKRRNGYAWVKALGGDAAVYISEKLYGNAELQMFLTNRKHPVDGHRMNRNENEVLIAREDFGVNRWIVSLFNDDSTCIPANKHESYIAEITGCYDWATVDQVAYMICLETDERFPNVNDVIQRAEWVQKYAPGKRVIVGSANVGFLKSVFAAAKARGIVIELWLEVGWNPVTERNKANWPAYLNQLTDLHNIGARVWAGEWYEPDPVKSKDLTNEMQGVAGFGFGRFV